MIRRRLFLVMTAFTVAVTSSIATVGLDHVEANSTIKNKIKSVQEERSGNKGELGQKEMEIKAVEGELKKREDEIREIDSQTADTNQKIRLKDNEIEETKDRVDELMEEVRVLEERIAERDDLLKSRVRSMYKNGGSIDYLEVVFGAQDFGDLINRLTALNTIAQQDQNILEAHHNDKILVEEVKVLMEQELIALEDQLVELEGLKATLEQQRKEKDRVIEQLEKQEGELHDELGELEEADQILLAQERAMEAELKAWQEEQRRLEEELKRQKEEAARKEAARKKAQESTPSATPSATESVTESVAPTPSVTKKGNFMRPATGTITSFHGPRWGRIHHGIDIGKNGRSGDIPIVAVEAGTVISSYYSSSYGNTVLLSHNVGGQVITTLYAHMENRFVTAGQRVEKGQKLGYMGNTGRSFGAHLHFELHEGPWNGAKSNSVDPLRYIPRN